MSRVVAVHAQAGPTTGLGHAMRCIALAEAMTARGREPVFALADAPPALVDGLTRRGIRAVSVAASVDALAEAVRTLDAAWVVLDGYDLGPAHCAAARGTGARVLVVDDGLAPDPLAADVVVNQNIYANAADYRDRVGPTCRVLAGPAFALLRSEFARRAPVPDRVPAAVGRALVTFGGADPSGAARKLLEALARAKPDTRGAAPVFDVVVGGANRDVDALRVLAHGLGDAVALHVDVDDLSARAARADLALSAGGSTVLELLFMGVPLVVGHHTDGELRVCRALVDADLADHVGSLASLTGDHLVDAVHRAAARTEVLRARSLRGRALVDGRGAGRVVDVMDAVDAGARA